MTTAYRKPGKRRLLRWIWRILGSMILLLLGLVIIVPIVFKDAIIETARVAIERNIEGEFNFENANLGMLRTFPNFCLEMSGVTVSGKRLDSLTAPLFTAEQLELALDFWTVVYRDKPIRIVGLTLGKPEVNLIISRDGSYNYDIMPEGTSASDSSSILALDIESYSIDHGSLFYSDAAAGIAFSLRQFQHTGRLKYDGKEIDIAAITQGALVSFTSDGITYLNDAAFAGEIPLHVDLDSNLYRIGDAQLDINALRLSLSGDIITSPEMQFDLSFASTRGTFKEFLSLLPSAYTDDFDEVRASGNLTLSGSFQGTYNPSARHYPQYAITLGIDDGRFQYPGKSLAVEEIQVDGRVANRSSSWNPEVFDLGRFHLILNEAPIDGRLKAEELTGARKITGTITGRLSLADLLDAYPVEGIQTLSGNADMNVEFDLDARKSAVQQHLAGRLTIGSLLVQNEDQQVAARLITSEFSPETVTLRTEDATVDFYPVEINLKATNTVPWYLGNDTLQLAGVVNAGKLDFTPSGASDSPMTAHTGTALPLDRLSFDLSVRCDTLVYDEYVFSDFAGRLTGTTDNLKISQAHTTIRGSSLSGDGRINNATGYAIFGEKLQGNLNLYCNQVNIENWLSDTYDTSGLNEFTYAELPPSLDIAVTFKVGQLTYGKMRLISVNGAMYLGEHIVRVDQMTANGLGGVMKLAGMYGTQPGQSPDFNLKYDLSQLRFRETFEQTRLFPLLAPIAKFIEGEFSSTMVMQGKLAKNYLPDLLSLTASGYLETIHGRLEKAQVLDKVSTFLNIDPPLTWDLGYTRNWFEIQDGAVELKEFTKQFEDISVTMYGKHRIEGPMDYHMRLTIPSERISSTPAGALAQEGLNAIKQKLGAFGRNLQSVESVIVDVDLSGKLTDPQLKVAAVKINQQSAGDMVKGLITETTQQLTDTARTIVQTQIRNVRDSAQTVARGATDSLQNVIKQKLAETGQSVVDQGRQQLNTRTDSAAQKLIDSTNTSALDILGEKTANEIQKIQGKLDNWKPLKKKN